MLCSLVVREIFSQETGFHVELSRGSCCFRQLNGIWSAYIKVALVGLLQGSSWQVLWFSQA